jgi:hypothetical protein
MHRTGGGSEKAIPIEMVFGLKARYASEEISYV